MRSSAPFMMGAASRYAKAAFASATASCSFTTATTDELEGVDGLATDDTGTDFALTRSSWARAFGVSDELVAEDRDRRAREISSCSLKDEAFVDGSSDRLVVMVGEVV